MVTLGEVCITRRNKNKMATVRFKNYNMDSEYSSSVYLYKGTRYKLNDMTEEKTVEDVEKVTLTSPVNGYINIISTTMTR